VIICATVFIYIYAGKEIYNKTKMLRDFHKAGLCDPSDIPTNPFNGGVVVNTIISTTSAPVDLDQLTPTGRRSTAGPAGTPDSKCEVSITAGSPESPVEQPRGNVNSFSYDGSYDEKPSESRPLPALPTSPVSAQVPTTPISTRRPSINPATSMVATTAMLAYTKVAVLFFLAMMMTWIPSSANRVYSVIYPDDVSVFLESFSAFVLPLQGFWNAVIYAATSIDACKNLWHQIKTTKRISCNGFRNIIHGFPTDGELVPTPAANHVVPNNNNNRHSCLQDHGNESEARLKESRPQTAKSRVDTADSTEAIINQVNSREASRVTSRVTSLEYSEEYPCAPGANSPTTRGDYYEYAHQPANRVTPSQHVDNPYARALYERDTGREYQSSRESSFEDYSRGNSSAV
jgi:hypothetical protein